MLFPVVAAHGGGGREAKAPRRFPAALVDLAFFAANVPKIPAGGWFPLSWRLVLGADGDVAAGRRSSSPSGRRGERPDRRGAGRAGDS